MNRIILFMLLFLMIKVGLNSQTLSINNQVKDWTTHSGFEKASYIAVEMASDLSFNAKDYTIDMYFKHQSNVSTIVFEKAVSVFTLTNLSLMKGKEAFFTMPSFIFKGYNQQGDIVEIICLSNKGIIKEDSISIPGLKQEPVFISSEPISKLIIQPVNISKECVIHFEIDGIMTGTELVDDLPISETLLTDCLIKEVNLIMDHSSSITSLELENFKRHAWNLLQQLTDKGLNVNIIEYGQQAESVVFQQGLQGNNLLPGRPLCNYFFSTTTEEEKRTTRKAVNTLTNLESVFDYLKSNTANSITFVYTDRIPNQSNQTPDYLPKSAGIASILSGLKGVSNPLYFITNSAQLLGLDEYLQQNGHTSIFGDLNAEEGLNGIVNIEPCLEGNDLEPVIKIEPNPVSRNFTVHLAHTNEVQHYQAVLKDIAGREVLSPFSLVDVRTQVNVEHVAAGSYFLWVYSSTEMMEPIPVVIAR